MLTDTSEHLNSHCTEGFGFWHCNANSMCAHLPIYVSKREPQETSKAPERRIALTKLWQATQARPSPPTTQTLRIFLVCSCNFGCSEINSEPKTMLNSLHKGLSSKRAPVIPTALLAVSEPNTNYLSLLKVPDSLHPQSIFTTVPSV